MLSHRSPIAALHTHTSNSTSSTRWSVVRTNDNISALVLCVWHFSAMFAALHLQILLHVAASLSQFKHFFVSACAILSGKRLFAQMTRMTNSTLPSPNARLRHYLRHSRLGRHSQLSLPSQTKALVIICFIAV